MGIFRRKKKRRRGDSGVDDAVAEAAWMGGEFALTALFRVVGGAVRGLFNALT
ncbi:hypothetical protein [Nocardia sp. XZ_19_385]|uniref:hypothetical protein n=1 Tax=Nocardia sp. XZ_19_385 TaxID=2769488 RepID=UPI00188FA28B|nr:hypothetical protein [Nocardia sp. XZ_19_385]